MKIIKEKKKMINSKNLISERDREVPLYTPPGRVTRFDAPGIEFTSNIITVEFGEVVMLRSRTHGYGQTLS